MTEAAEDMNLSPFGPQGCSIVGDEYVAGCPGPRSLGGIDSHQDLVVP